MTGPADERLQRLLGGDHLVSLRSRLRRHYERAKSDGPLTRFRMSQISAQEYEILASLMGRPLRYSSSIQVDLDVIDTALRRADVAPSLRLALERLDGPIVHFATARAEAQAHWSAVVQECQHSILRTHVQSPMGLGLLKRLARGDPEVARRLCDRADAVLHRLPVKGLARAQLAAETLGDAHALDDGQATATLVVAAWRQRDSTSDVDDAASLDGTFSDERARDVWARAGVLVNELARPALYLNLPTHDQTSWAQMWGEPTFASLRRLLRSAPDWAVTGGNVYICENPNIVAIAADRLGAHCAPLVCTDGMPAAAQRTLLTLLAKAGASLYYHGDFDWPGVRIANHMMLAYGARPWRFGSEDYTAALACASTQRHLLSGLSTTASWDASLAPVMEEHAVAIAEEAVAEVLLQDLQQ
ncbi:TIGR02679 family protein [Hyphomicrobium sp. CS1BSMeth3]|uniref:TIGR02679 family protein n=1 Tax=Hyphomicrobium sp. CS1BSMeth3 TaxID=1892844 RepID=UPI00093132A1|nr:TIGR02679 family protein [Hyphomicrobium sp. CS1BSMeth3]